MHFQTENGIVVEHLKGDFLTSTDSEWLRTDRYPLIRFIASAKLSTKSHPDIAESPQRAFVWVYVVQISSHLNVQALLG